MILFLFFCSGATALIYEVVWSKGLSLMFGSTIQAQTVVLAVFMGGLALGNRLIGARADRLRKPLVAYGALEVLIGLYAFAFTWLYHQTDTIFIAAGSPLFPHAVRLLWLKFILSVALLFLPTVLMGGTLPLLVAWLQQQSADPGRLSARFYSTNSLGAVCGAWLAGFVLIRQLGIVSTLQMTGLANALIGFTAIHMGRRMAGSAVAQDTTAAGHAGPPAGQWPLRRLALLVALTGGVSMGLEVLATRSLTLIFGASVQAFAIVLMAFILGIGLGSAAVASPRFKRWQNEAAIFTLLLGGAAVIGILVWGIEQWVMACYYIRSGLAPTIVGYQFYQFMMGAVSLIILGLPAALLGAVLPLSIRLLAGAEHNLGRSVGRLLTWNTLGAVLGALLCGFVLMPRAGLRNAFNLLALALCAAAMLLAWSRRKTAWVLLPVLLAGGLLLSCVGAGEGWRYALTSAVFRKHEDVVDPTVLATRRERVRIIFYQDAPDATVSVEAPNVPGPPTDLGLRISGKPEASSSRADLNTQLMMSHLPMLARPESKDVFVLGLASGISCSAFLDYPIQRLDVAENCPPVLQAAQLFSPWNRGVLTNPVTHIYLEDGRTVLKLNPQKYDVVMSEPSNPWFASIGSVFSLEFYQLAASRLKPGGIMAQWFHVYEMHDGIVSLVLRTFAEVFPVMEIWDSNDGDIILLGSDRPWDGSLAALRKSYARDAVQHDLAMIGLGTPEALLARQFASQRTAFAIAGPGPIQSDAFPVLEYEAPRAFYIGRNAAGLARFDERTWQAPFASAERRAALAGLDDLSLSKAFEWSTINPELLQQILRRLGQPSTSTRAFPETFAAGTPCVFQTTPVKVEAQFPPQASEELQKLIRARVALQAGAADWAAQVQIIRGILLAHVPSAQPQIPGILGPHFAAVAARECIVHRNFELAAQLLNLGFKLGPDNPELGYLQRILERESSLPTREPAGARRL